MFVWLNSVQFEFEFSRHKCFLNTRCRNEPNTIFCLQEHWLRPPCKRIKGVNEFRHVHGDFDGYATSAMKKVIGNKILTGRPYGGTGLLWNKKFSNSIKPRLEYENDRVTVLEINESCGIILLINVYLPYYDNARIDEQLSIYRDTIGFIESVMCENSHCRFVLAGDFNCNLYNQSHPFSRIVRDLMHRWRLSSTFDNMDAFESDTTWTRLNNRGGVVSGTLLDYIIISENLMTNLLSVEIQDFPENTSDHLSVSIELSLTLADPIRKHIPAIPRSINWHKVTGEIKEQYESLMSAGLDSIRIPFDRLLHGNSCCDCIDHIASVEAYYNDIVSAINSAERCLPRRKPGVSKSFWNDELTELKSASVDAFILWSDSGKPYSGPIYELKRSTNSRFKLALRKAKHTFDQERCDTIHSDLINNNPNSFWKSWQKLHGKKDDCQTRINGRVNDTDIANEFAASFKKIYDNANSDRAEILSQRFDSVFNNALHDEQNYDISLNLLSWDNMLTIMSKLKPGKASGSLIKAEHILYGSPKLTIHLQLLFNSMIIHGYVPCDFLRGVITPIVKDAEGDVSSTDNYRGITLSNIFAYLFDHAILTKIERLLITSDLQFGYKKRHSTSHAIYTVKKCVNYFCEHGSFVYAAFLDCSKGFDRVSHDGLFLKLLERKVPLCWIRVLKYWYSNMYSICRWNDIFSDPFPVASGVRQGGVLSAYFWAVYMDDLVVQLRASGVGCYITDIFIACVLYADDVCLLAPSRTAMQRLLDICSSYAESWCIKYNEKKTKLMYFGKNFKTFTSGPITLNAAPLEMVDRYKYLGVTILTSNSFLCSAERPRSAFFRSANSILRVAGKPSETVLMRLLYSVCVPNVTYACDVTDFKSKDIESLHIAVNDAIRRIFSYNRWESIRDLRDSMGYQSITQIFAHRRRCFENNLPRIGNTLIRKLSTI